MHLVGFIIRIYHDIRSSEYQKFQAFLTSTVDAVECLARACFRAREKAPTRSKKKLVGLESGRDLISKRRILVHADSRNAASRINIL